MIAAPQLGSMPPPAMPAHATEPAPRAGAAADDPNVVSITSPFVGTFYRAPSPDAKPFVDVGTDIRAGQVICIVEAMKLMNEIEAEIAGTIVEILVENGKPVEYGDALFKVRKPG
jgi:acetyl-CoA carboxylase biotin carboxyl carrier protein